MSPLRNDLSEYIEGLPSNINIKEERSEASNTTLWSITSPVKAASGKTVGLSTENLGKPKNLSRWFALVRLWSPWLAPRQGKEQFQPDKEAVLAAFERHDGSHLVVLAISGKSDVLTTLTHDSEGSIVVKSQNDSEKKDIARVIVSVGKALESAVAAVMYHTRKLMMRYDLAPHEENPELKAMMNDFKPEWLENWCTFSKL